ncbi:MAG: S-layer homology domain-containing protein, partial [Gemmatimonadota bacterium]
VGSALVAMEQGEYHRALQEVEEALHRDRRCADAYIARGRVLTAQGRVLPVDSGAWLPGALEAFRHALRLEPESDPARYHEAMAFYWAGTLAAARGALAPIIARNRGELVPAAMAQTERIQQIERASPGSPRGLDIARRDQLTRAELAVLLVEELKLPELVRQRRLSGHPPGFAPPGAGSPTPPDSASDTGASWARPWIETVLRLGVPGLEPMPDGSFAPDEVVTRATYARVNEGILELITGDSSLATRYVGQVSPFPDVRADSYAYNAIALSVARGIMSTDTVTGRFRPDDTVSGAEALLIIRDLQNAVRMEF